MELAPDLLPGFPMNQRTLPLPTLAEVLPVLESLTFALKTQDRGRSSDLRVRAQAILRSRPLDSGDRMILEKVLGRIRKAAAACRWGEALDLT